MRHDLDQIRREVSLAKMIGRSVKLSRSGRGFKGLCPFHKEKTPSFTVSDEKGFYHCFGCGSHGDVFAWLEETEGLSFKEALESLAEQVSTGRDRAGSAIDIEQRESTRPARNSSLVGSATVGRYLWNKATPARGEIVEAYLASRSLDPKAAGMIDALRYHPYAPTIGWPASKSPADAWGHAPAMIAPIADADGNVRGVHATYLRPDGKGKADLGKNKEGQARPTRKIWGRARLGATWLVGTARTLDPAVPLVAGEGIETVWAFVEEFGRPCQAVATLSLNNLQGSAKKLGGGSIPLWRPEPDPNSPAFTVPFAGETFVIVDADMKPLENRRIQRRRGERPTKGTISSLERSELCASLAVASWRAAGASHVSALRPDMGRDFNDQIRHNRA